MNQLPRTLGARGFSCATAWPKRSILADLGSQGIVVKCTAAIFSHTVDWTVRGICAGRPLLVHLGQNQNSIVIHQEVKTFFPRIWQ